MKPLAEEIRKIARDRISQLIGIYYKEEQRSDFQKALEDSSKEFGYSDLEAWVQSILTEQWTKDSIMRLAKYFTINESYFFREEKAFQILQHKIFPEMIEKMTCAKRPIRIWCAGCATGEEAYTLSIVSSQCALRDPFEYKILATDIHGENLKNAKKGIFGMWSFRNMPNMSMQQYFTSVKHNTWKIKKEYMDPIQFDFLNLVDDSYPSILNKTADLDIIFCRNVLMYFSIDQQRKVMDRFYNCLTPGGFLFVSVTEVSSFIKTPFKIRSHDGIHYYRKPSLFENQAREDKGDEAIVSKPKIQKSVYSYPLPADPIISIPISQNPKEMADSGYLARASDGNMDLLKQDRLNPKLYYLQSLISAEQGNLTESIELLKKCIYLNPDHILSHFFLGVYYQKLNQKSKSQKFFHQALRLLKTKSCDDVIEDSDQMSAERMKVLLQSWVKEEMKN